MYNVKKFLSGNLKELGIILGNGHFLDFYKNLSDHVQGAKEIVYSSEIPEAYPYYTGKGYIVLILGLVSAVAGSYFLYRKFRKRKPK